MVVIFPTPSIDEINKMIEIFEFEFAKLIGITVFKNATTVYSNLSEDEKLSSLNHNEILINSKYIQLFNWKSSMIRTQKLISRILNLKK